MESAPFLSDVAFGPDGGRAFWLRCADDVRIRLGVWGEGSKGTVLMYPGRTEYVEKYGGVAADLAEAGYASVAIDWRGQGLADRIHDNRDIGHVARFTDYQQDVRAVLKAIAELDLPKPLYLAAHSMGGCIGLRSLFEGLDVRAACFSAPMWGIQIAAMMRPIAWGLSSLSRPLRFSHAFAPGQGGISYVATQPFEGNTLTTDPDQYARFQAQLDRERGLSLGGPSLHWLNEALREMRMLAARPSPEVPTVTYLGGAEKIVDPGRIRSRMAQWPGGRLEVLPGAEHEVFMERPEHRDRAIAGMIALFDDPARSLQQTA